MVYFPLERYEPSDEDEVITVTPDLELRVRYGDAIHVPGSLRVRYYPRSNFMLVSTPAEASDFRPGGRLEDEFVAVLNHLSERYPSFSEIGLVSLLGDIDSDRARPVSEFLGLPDEGAGATFTGYRRSPQLSTGKSVRRHRRRA